jgi:hypothetical protein
VPGREDRAGVYRFIVGILGVAAVPVGFAALAASGFGYVAWLITLIGILLAGSGFDAAEGRYVGWLLAGYFAYTVFSCFVSYRIMRKIPDASQTTSSAVGLVFIWGLLLMGGTIAVLTWYDLW